MSADGPSRRLDPDRAAAEAARRANRPTEPVIDTRPYRRMIGAIGLTLAIGISALLFITRGFGPIGVPPGQRLHWFVAPLATGNVDKDANLNPHCDPSHPNEQALNVCPWLADRSPLVLAFFVSGSSDCVRQVDTVQDVSREFGSAVSFAAVDVRASRRTTMGLVRAHRWTIPVAFDLDGAVGDIYGVEVCPLLELANRGGTVAYRLTGDHWLSASALAAKVKALER